MVGRRSISGSCHFLVVIGLVLVGKRHFGDITVGVAAAAAYLLLPYIALHLTKVDHVVPSALLVWAVACYKKPRLAGALVGIAGGGFIFPFVVAPVWIHFYKRRGMSKFLIAFAIAAVISLAVAAAVLWFNTKSTWQIPTTIGLPDLRKWRAPKPRDSGRECIGRIASRCSSRPWRSRSSPRFGPNPKTWRTCSRPLRPTCSPCNCGTLATGGAVRSVVSAALAPARVPTESQRVRAAGTKEWVISSSGRQVAWLPLWVTMRTATHSRTKVQVGSCAW